MEGAFRISCWLIIPQGKTTYSDKNIAWKQLHVSLQGDADAIQEDWADEKFRVEASAACELENLPTDLEQTSDDTRVLDAKDKKNTFNLERLNIASEDARRGLLITEGENWRNVRDATTYVLYCNKSTINILLIFCVGISRVVLYSVNTILDDECEPMMSL